MFHIYPLTSLDIGEYLDKMIALKKFKKDDKDIFLKQAQVLIDKEFLNNFLVLSLLVNIFKAEKELPENKIDLYKKCFDYIAKRREKEKIKSGYNWNNIYPLMKDSTFINLSTLAAPNNSDIKKEEVENLLRKQYKTKYSNEAEAEYAIKEFLEFCSNRTELFVPSSVDDKFKFFHRSFFEYFYARYIHQQSTIEEMYRLMIAFDVDSEVFELAIALVKEDNETKYQKLLEYIFEQIEVDFSKPQPNFVAFGMLSLGMQVIDDIYYINRYYKLLINFSKIIKCEKVYIMNQRLLQLWLQKGIGENKERKEEFKNSYESDCIKYILNLFSYFKKESNLQDEIIFDSRIRYRNEFLFSKNLFERIMVKTPFFILVYQYYFNIEETLDTFNVKLFNKWLTNQEIFSRKEKSNFKKGLQTYNILKGDELKHFIQIILR